MQISFVVTISSLFFRQFRLVIKYDKSEVFYFSRVTKNFNPPPLQLRPLEDMVLRQKDIWWYLGFFFGIKLLFWHYAYNYTNKVLLTIKNMKILGNLTRGLLLLYKYLLYKICVLSIALYDFQLWYFKGALLYHSLKELKKTQRKVAL